MVKRNNVEYTYVWYDLDIGYHTFWNSRYWTHNFTPLHDFKIPKNLGTKTYCVLVPKYPNYNNSVFSAGDLKKNYKSICSCQKSTNRP